MASDAEYRDWIKRLHAIAEEFRVRDENDTWLYRLLRRHGWFRKRPEDQCALRWSANVVAEKLKGQQPESKPC